MKILKKLYNGFYVKLFPNYYIMLEKATRNCKTLLDVGCGESSPIMHFTKKITSTGVDAYKPSIEKSKKRKIHNKYIQANILNLKKKIKPKSYDCVLASDVIEHLEKKEGYKLLEDMEKIAKRKVIIYTPNGFMPQGETDGNPWQVHKSGWTPEEMKKRGYKVIGINGIKGLRGEYYNIKYNPIIFWTFISHITQHFVKNNPKKATSILCIKNIKP